MLEKEFEYYLKNKGKLVKEYEGKYIVIKGEEVVGVYDSELEAYQTSKDKYSLGTFLIQPCTKGDADVSQTFHSRVVIN